MQTSLVRPPHRGRLAAVAAVASLAACSRAATAPPPVNPTPARIVFSVDSFDVNEGHTGQLTWQVLDAAGKVLSNATVQFTSADSLVATVAADGSVSGVAPGGVAIHASVGSVSADEHVDVMGHPEGILIGSDSLSARPFGVAVSHDGVVYVTRLDADSLAITDVTSRAITGGIRVGSVPTGVAFDPTGTTAYVTNQFSDNIGFVDVAQGLQADSVHITGDPFVVVASPDGTRLYASNNTTWVFVIDPASRTVVDSIPVGTAPNGFAVAPNDSIVYVSAFVGGTVSEINLHTNAVLRTFQVGGTPQDMIVSRDGTELYIANEAGELDVWSLQSGTSITTVPLAAGAFGMALSPDQEHLYVSLPDAGQVDVIDIPSRTIIHTIDVGGRPRRIAFDYHGGTAVVANEDGWVSFVR